ncbi:MAG TPA: GNAT family N-acetyltransferase [Roseiflexaceae bacterium]|nr:GNAT family N-acetyltransferase [Roseiflexaceae bacterium]
MLDLTHTFAIFPVLETERLILRAVEPDDADALFRMMSDPRVMRYYGRPPLTSIDEVHARITGIRTAFEQREGIRWAITSRADGAVLGHAGFWRLIKEHFRAEIGYQLAAEYWGRGIAPEAVGAALRYGFAGMGLHSVEAQIAPANVASRRVLEKLGFAQEGYLRECFYLAAEDRFEDTAVFSLLKSAWQARGGA